MKKIVLSILAVSLVLTSCSREFTETQFHQEEKAAPITTVEQLESFINGTYVKMRSASYLGSFYRAYGEIHTDEMYNTHASGRNRAFATYQLQSTTSEVGDTWYAIYQVIGNANIVINAPENLTWGQSSNPAQVSAKIKDLKAQAYAARALALFDLLKLYGQEYSGGTLGVVVPTQFNPNALMPRATVEETRMQIESDFRAALSNIKEASNDVVAVKTFLNANSIKALMSRYYLYKKNYAEALKYAKEVIDSGSYSVATQGDLALSFAKDNASNSLFEIAVGLNGSLGTTHYDYLVNSGGYANMAVLESVISNVYTQGDVRLNLLKKDGEYYLDGKFSNLKGISNIKLVRYEEVLLNAAEAALQIGDQASAINYMNQIRKNRGIGELQAI